MDFQTLSDTILSTLAETVPNLFLALLILIVGWLLAVVVRALMHKVLGIIKLNDQFKKTTDDSMDVETLVASAAFWLIILFVLAQFFRTLNLGSVADPLQSLVTELTDYVPNLLGAFALAIVAWVAASVSRTLGTKALEATQWDKKISSEAGMQPISENAGNVLYWLVILLFLPAILSTLQLGGLLDPVRNLVDEILIMLPNIVGAIIIGVIGWFVAGLLRDLVTNLLAAMSVDSLGTKVGLSEDIRLSRVAGLIVFIFVFVPALIGALNALQIEAISTPATEMLSTFMAAIPKIFAAVVIVTVAYFLARFISGLLSRLLHGFGADDIPEKMGLGQVAEGDFRISDFAGVVASVFIFLFATVEAANQLGFEQIQSLVTSLIELAGQILLGSIILVAGFWLANVAHKGILRISGDTQGAPTLANLARLAILGLVLAMGLRAMGIADDIVNLAFALVLGAVAVAFALSFGLGGRDAAGKQMEYWLKRFRN